MKQAIILLMLVEEGLAFRNGDGYSLTQTGQERYNDLMKLYGNEEL